jgi:transcriptional regulator GlxA family with amidase domain
MADQFRVVFALYPDVTQLDFTGPLEVFARLPGAHCLLASVDGGTIHAAGAITFADVLRLDRIPDCTLLCVPGGFGTIGALADQAYLHQLRRLAGGARYVTSVCTGSLLLAAAGLLAGKRAACHWAWRDSLCAFGVTPDAGRVVHDGRVITGGGVTAGIDMALEVAAQVAGVDYAQTLQLSIEYAPAPPFDAGRPECARPEIVLAARRRLDAQRSRRDAAVARAAALLREATPGRQPQANA